VTPLAWEIRGRPCEKVEPNSTRPVLQRASKRETQMGELSRMASHACLASASGTAIQVVIVEDEVLVASEMEAVLQQAGAEVLAIALRVTAGGALAESEVHRMVRKKMAAFVEAGRRGISKIHRRLMGQGYSSERGSMPGLKTQNARNPAGN